MRILVVVLSLAPALALAAPANGFKHIIVVVQENRTVDNLFGSNPTFEPGVDIATKGLNSHGQTIQLGPIPLDYCYDVDHSHNSFEESYDNGRMDGADLVLLGGPKYHHCSVPLNPQYKYVDNSTGSVQPYFDIAENYGFANRMFQTNQGPSFPAHLFLFGASSAPTANSPAFVAENKRSHVGGVGCTAPPSVRVNLIGPTGNENAYKPIYPCLDHDTMADLLDGAGLSWTYYNDQVNSEKAVKSGWNAPAAFRKLCGSNGNGATASCAARRYIAHVSWQQAKILRDIGNCALPAVSWVIPRSAYSDHAGVNQGTGPDWVASIVNAVGQQPLCRNGETYWNDTAILITWDDWGGWYDHVPPFLPNGRANGWGKGYTYGFRVPLLVVSAFTPPGYVDNADHDFGSILAFIEKNYGLGKIGPGTYADAYADGLDSYFRLGTSRKFLAITQGSVNRATFLLYSAGAGVTREA